MITVTERTVRRPGLTRGTAFERNVRVRKALAEPAAEAVEARADARPEGRFLRVLEERVEDGYGQQCQQQTERLAADDEHADGAVRGGAGARAEDERNHAGDERNGRHQNWAQAVAVRLDDGAVALHAVRTQLIRVVD